MLARSVSDGQRVAYRLMLAGDQETIRAQDGISLGLGSAGALTMFLNGAPVRSLGKIGEVVNVRMTRENYRSFLSPRRALGRPRGVVRRELDVHYLCFCPP
jgi:hypothetical protein